MRPFSLNIRGRLVDFDRPSVMSIINVTPDSFYAESRVDAKYMVAERVSECVAKGAAFIDIGACSTRPGSSPVSAEEELRRLEPAIDAARLAAPDAIISVDTFRADVARIAISSLGADIINDISGGWDEGMFETAASLKAPYILTHMRGKPHCMMQHAEYTHLVPEVLCDLAAKLQQLNLLGVCDVIIDPGFGFSKDMRQNYELLSNLDALQQLGAPMLAGLSRKSMITKLLGISAEDALNATTALNMWALQHGAAILRVHDTEAAVQTVKLFCELTQPISQKA